MKNTLPVPRLVVNLLSDHKMWTSGLLFSWDVDAVYHYDTNYLEVVRDKKQREVYIVNRNAEYAYKSTYS